MRGAHWPTWESNLKKKQKKRKTYSCKLKLKCSWWRMDDADHIETNATINMSSGL